VANSPHLSSEDSRFIADAKRAPRLTPEQETRLAERWRRNGDPAAADRLARAQMREVVGIALRFRYYGVSLAELVAEGNYGVVRALAKYDPERRVRFTTYANYWVRSYVLLYIIRSWSIAGGGSGALRTRVFFKLRRERARAYALFGETDSADSALATAMGLPQHRVVEMLQQLERDVPLESERSGRSVVDTLAGPENPEQSLYQREVEAGLKASVNAALSTLDARERYIAEQCLLAPHEEAPSLAQIGRTLGVSRERARQIHARASVKLRKHILMRADRSTAEWLQHESLATSP